MEVKLEIAPPLRLFAFLAANRLRRAAELGHASHGSGRQDSHEKARQR